MVVEELRPPELEEQRPEEQPLLFEMPPAWEDMWRGMPKCTNEDLGPWASITVHFRNEQGRRLFASLVGTLITDRTRSVWYPPAPRVQFSGHRYVAQDQQQAVPKYPIYVISKGRWESRLTVRALEECGLDYRLVIEPQEYDQYAAVLDPARIIQLPFSNLGQGSIPARNYVWELSRAQGDRRHWILDDNIHAFYRYHNNTKIKAADGSLFVAAETFTDRFTNVAISGFNYEMFVPRKRITPPLTLNTRVYSCILLRNDLPYSWRGRYNEDTDLSLRALKDGHCTVLFNAFLADKVATMRMKGGNTDELYQEDGRLQMAQSLVEQHPDVARVTRKFNRYQHHVDYRPFKGNKLIPIDTAEPMKEFSLQLIALDPGASPPPPDQEPQALAAAADSAALQLEPEAATHVAPPAPEQEMEEPPWQLASEPQDEQASAGETPAPLLPVRRARGQQILLPL